MANRDTRALVAHLFRRAGFGLRPNELDSFTKLGVQGSVDYLINYQSVNDPADQQYPPPDLSQFFAPQLPPSERTLETQKAAGKLRGQAALTIKEWWVNRMLTTTRPLQEKMTLFWHGHFATALTKSQPELMLPQNMLFRSMALGNFNTLLKAVNQDPAMLRWLDGDLNRVGKPNENFSRELMELFTLGLGHYTEKDVQEGARAFTGWLIDYRQYRRSNGTMPVTSRFIPRFHDDGVKTFLGHTGNIGSDEMMDILSAHPATGGFIAYKLFSFFANDNPTGATLQPFIDTYYNSKYDIKAMVRQILLSDAFYSDQSFQQHFKSPVEFVVGTVRELGSAVPVPQMVRSMAVMGQELFNPPNVGGWPGGLTWATADALVARFNLAGLLAARRGVDLNNLNPQQLVQQSGARDTPGLVDYLLARFIGVGASPATRAALISYLGGSGPLSTQTMDAKVRGLVQLVLGSPEYQLN